MMMIMNRRNFRVFGVEKHDGDVRFKSGSGSGNVTISCMCNASSHNYRNSLVILDVAMGQIPRSTERISCFQIKLYILFYITDNNCVDLKPNIGSTANSNMLSKISREQRE